MVSPIVFDTATQATPDQIAGLALWLDAQQPMFTAAYAAQCANDGDVIAFWPDRSTTGNAPLAPSTGSPTYKKSAINGYPAVNLNGTSKFTTPAINLANCTIFIVMSAPGLATNKVIMQAGSGFWIECNRTTNTFNYASGGTVPASSAGAPLNISADTSIGVVRYDGASMCLMYDRQFANNGPSATASLSTFACTGTLAASVAVTLGDLAAGGFTWPGYIGEVLIYNVALSQDNTRQVYDYLQAKWGIGASNLVICTGDSLTSGQGSTGGAAQAMLTPVGGTNYPNRMWNSLGAGTWQVKCDSYPGRNLVQMNTETLTYGDLLFSPRGSGKNIQIIWGGTNDVAAYSSAGQAISQYQKLCKQKKSFGWKVIAATMLLRQDGTATQQAAFALNQAAFNTWLRANYTQFADYLVDLTAIPQLTNPANTTYFNADKVHLTDAGHQLVANAMAFAVQQL